MHLSDYDLIGRSFDEALDLIQALPSPEEKAQALIRHDPSRRASYYATRNRPDEEDRCADDSGLPTPSRNFGGPRSGAGAQEGREGPKEGFRQAGALCHGESPRFICRGVAARRHQ
jgi:hypothetical protein